MAQRLSQSAQEDLLAELQRVEQDTTSTSLELCRTLDDVLRTSYILATEDELQSYASFAARQVYVHQTLEVPHALAQALENIRRWLYITLKRGIEYPREQLRPIITTLRTWIEWHDIATTPPLPETIAPENIAAIEKASAIPSVVRIIVRDRSTIRDLSGAEIPILYGTIEQTNQAVTVQLHQQWRKVFRQVHRGSTLHLINPRRLDAEMLACTSESLVVIEPDFLLDVTTVAECFSGSTNSPLLALLRLLLPAKVRPETLSGAIVNACFDEMLANPTVDTTAAVDRALRVRYLDALAAKAIVQNFSLAALVETVHPHLETLRAVIAGMNGRATTEPSFIAPRYGIQGRLDVLLYSDAGTPQYNVIELKSGTAPARQIPMATSTGKQFYTDLRPNHLMQVTGYNLLLDAAYPQRRGTSSILYSQAKQSPLRNAPNSHDMKADFLDMRNRIVSVFWSLAHRRFQSIEHLMTMDETRLPPFYHDDFRALKHAFGTLSEQESLYIRAFLGFAFREWIAAIVGNSWRGQGLATMWRQSIEQKIEQMNALAYLHLDRKQSNIECGYLTLTFTDRTPTISPFRNGDVVVLYPHAALDEEGNVYGQVFKAVIRSLDDRSVTVSLRNKLFDRMLFESDTFWALDADVLSIGIESAVRACGEFMRLPAERRQLLLGKRPPLTKAISIPRPDSMTDTQYHLLCKALAARDYFLLEGPPGTGKTSTMLRTMVEYLLAHRDETILCCALTNRAVDEICSALRRTIPPELILRMGSLENTEHTDLSFAEMARREDFDTLYQRLGNARVIVATVPYLNANPALFALKTFSTAIIDEAAQLLEPHLIGIIACVGRFILIGDACQLPAVVQQEERASTVAHPLLDDIALQRLDASLFERLLRLAKRRGWDHAHGRLTEQARMHHTVAEFPGMAFYGTRFGTMQPWQTLDTDLLPIEELPLFLRYRLVFLDTPVEAHTRYNRTEATIAALCAQVLARYLPHLHRTAIGIITPFRKQIRAIVELLDTALRHTITVDTVERFQGSERDHIIISCAVNSPHDLRLIESVVELDGRIIDRKLNVALTRARQQVIVIGNRVILQHSKSYTSLLDHIERNGIVLSAHQALDMLSPYIPSSLSV